MHRPLVPLEESLRDVGLFGGLDSALLEKLAHDLQTVELAIGHVLFHEGETGRELYVVLDGEIEILKHSRQGRESRVAILGPGDWFGEMAVLDVMPRSATARAIAPCHLLRLTSQDLEALYRSDLKSYALILMNISREMSRKLRVADGILADFIANVAEQYSRRRS
jgi:CRP/FNR family transcriptional regulator, cyclic AMP receptor protein